MKALVRRDKKVELLNIETKELQLNQVRIKVCYVGLCRTDLLVAKGIIGDKNNIVLGHEFSGYVVESKSLFFNIGDRVSYNPLLNGFFMGLEYDGCLSEEVIVEDKNVIKSEANIDLKYLAYLEPVAASMAVLKGLNNCNNKKIGIYGKNRISELTYIILKSYKFDVDLLDENDNYDDNSYDIVIETLFKTEYISKIIQIIKPEGKLILKSRNKLPVEIISNDLIVKEITLQAVNYYDFNDTMKWLEHNYLSVEHLLGDEYYIDDWKNAFDKAEMSETKKIFIYF